MRSIVCLTFASLLLAAAFAEGESSGARPVIQAATTTAMSIESPIEATPCTEGESTIFVTSPQPNEYCGACSSSVCQGVPRGQMCFISGKGWGNCGIYNVFDYCSDGKLRCFCSTGSIE